MSWKTLKCVEGQSQSANSQFERPASHHRGEILVHITVLIIATSTSTGIELAQNHFQDLCWFWCPSLHAAVCRIWNNWPEMYFKPENETNRGGKVVSKITVKTVARINDTTANNLSMISPFLVGETNYDDKYNQQWQTNTRRSDDDHCSDCIWEERQKNPPKTPAIKFAVEIHPSYIVVLGNWHNTNQSSQH